MTRGFGKPRQPTFWIQVIYADEELENIPVYCKVEKAVKKARDIVANTHPPVDTVLLMEGKADPNCPGSDDILADLRPRPFVSLGQAARRAS